MAYFSTLQKGNVGRSVITKHYHHVIITCNSLVCFLQWYFNSAWIKIRHSLKMVKKVTTKSLKFNLTYAMFS